MEQGVDSKTTYPPRTEIALMPGYYSPQIEVSVRLNANEAPEPPPEQFITRLAAEISEIPMNRYPAREATRLREAIARHHGVDVTQVYCANGSNEVLQSVLLAYGGANRSVAVFEPTYALHAHIARVTGTAVLAGSRTSNFLIDINDYERLVSDACSDGDENPAVTFVCSPNNPTGMVEPEETIVAILDRAPGLVIVDEAYGQFAPKSSIELLSRYRNLLVVRTFSKTWSLAALRLGYVIADPSVIDALWRVTLPYHLDAIKQVAGTIAIDFESEMSARVDHIVAERQRLLGELAMLHLEVVPSEANFILFRAPFRSGAEVWNELVRSSVLIRDISGFPHLEGYLRVTIGSPEENDRFLEALRSALQ